MKGKYNMNTKGKIDFTKTDNIQFIEEVASEISKEDKGKSFHNKLSERRKVQLR